MIQLNVDIGKNPADATLYHKKLVLGMRKVLIFARFALHAGEATHLSDMRALGFDKLARHI